MPFQPTRPLRGATDVGFCHVGLNRISTHAPLAGRDCRAPPRGSPASAYFNPRAPCGARLPFPSAWQRTLPFQPTRPLRGATCVELAVAEQMIFQPTRPLRGATTRTVHVDRDQDYFNPRAPCGARLLPCRASRTLQTFQPTRPLRGATTAEQQYCIAQGHFNPRAPCGARLWNSQFVLHLNQFQPTRPLRGATRTTWQTLTFGIFQPTRPLRGATAAPEQKALVLLISTHAPLAGRDRWRPDSSATEFHFNPRAPCGARLHRAVRQPRALLFQPTRPLRGATASSAPRTGPARNFNPRAPCGARQQKCTNHYAHFCDNRQISDAFAQNAACQGILLLFDAGKPCGFWVRTAQVISAHLCFAL